MRERITALAGGISRLRLGRPRAAAAFLVQVVGLGAVVYGVSLIFLPAAFIVLGIGAVLWSQGVER